MHSTTQKDTAIVPNNRGTQYKTVAGIKHKPALCRGMQREGGLAVKGGRDGTAGGGEGGRIGGRVREGRTGRW